MKHMLEICLLLIACASTVRGNGTNETHSAGPMSHPWVEDRPEPLVLGEALRRALLANPALQAYSWELRAAEARRLRAVLFPNPELGVEAENFAGSGEFHEIDATETTIHLSQLIELGSKRDKRGRVARLGRTVAEIDFEARRLEVFREVTQEFIRVLGTQRRLEWAEESLRLTEKFAPSAQRRVEAGAASQVELLRFNLQVAGARVARDQTKRDLAAARKRLAAMWGSGEPRFERVVGDLDQLPIVPSLEESLHQLARSPVLQRWQAETERRSAAIALEEANAFPDVTVGAGVRHFNDSGDAAAVAQVSIPLPLFNRNQGAVQEARAVAGQAEAERRAAEIRIRTELQVAYDDLAGARSQIGMLKETILPQAKDAYEKVNEGYLAGRFTYLEMVDAQNSLTQANVNYIESLAVYHLAVAQIEGLTGRANAGSPAEPSSGAK